jgi:hypothetical protein
VVERSSQADSAVPERTARPGLRSGYDLLFPLGLAIVVAVLGLFIHLRWYPVGNMGVETDFYLDLGVAARKIAAGHLSALDFPHKGPLYPLLVAALHPLVGDWYRSAVLLSILCAACALVILYRILLRLFHRSVATAATLMLAATPTFFVDGHKAATDHLFLLLALGSLFFLLRARARLLHAAAAGALAGLALLTRYNAAALVPAGIMILLWIRPPAPHADRLKAAALFLASFLVFWAPWGVLNLVQTGALVPSGNLVNVVLEYFPDPTTPNRPSRVFHSFIELVAAAPVRFIGHFLMNVPRHLWLDARNVLDPVSGLLLLIGCLRLWGRRPTREQAAFYFSVVLYLCSLALSFYLPRVRFLVHAALFALVFSALFGDGRSSTRPSPREKPEPSGEGGPTRGKSLPAFGLSWSGGLRPRPLALVLAGLMLVPNLWRTVSVERSNLQQVPLDVLPAAEYLRTHIPNPERYSLLSFKPHLPFLAGMRYQGYPWEVKSYAGFLAYIKQTGVSMVAVGTREARGVPGMWPIAQADSLPGLRLIYADEYLGLFLVPRNLDIDTAAARFVPGR